MKCDKCESKDLTVFLIRDYCITYKCEDCGRFVNIDKVFWRKEN